MAFYLSELAARIGRRHSGADPLISGVAPLHLAAEGMLAFVAAAKHVPAARVSTASALVVSADVAEQLSGRNLIVSDCPQLDFARLAQIFRPRPETAAAIHPSAIIEADAQIGRNCSVGANVYIGSGCVIGDGCRIGAGCVIEAGCVLGDGVRLHANVTVCSGSRIGNRSQIHSGAVIGSDGFGNAWHEGRWHKIPQVGGVRIGEDVEIGANTTVDCGALEDTVIENGARIDNLVQIAHNVRIGEDTAIAACVGIAGSTKIGARCQIGGAAMFVGHIDIADGTVIGGGTLVSGSIEKAGYYASSYPLQTHKDWVRNAVHLRRLNELHRRVRQLESTAQTEKPTKEP